MLPQKGESPQEEIPEPSYFELQAYWGATKHMGGLNATKELIGLCHINKDTYLLDVGCGVGATPCYIAKRHSSKVIGIDISGRMIDRAKERARREGLENKVEFRVADVQNLPFGHASFDVTIGESVLTFVKDKRRAVSECVRVTKPGGYVGLNEETWVMAPSQEFVEYASRMWDIEAEILTQNGWEELLRELGSRDLVARTRTFDASWGEYISEISRYGVLDFLGMSYRAIAMYVKSPAFRKYTKGRYTSLPKHFFEYLGYGIYVGRK